MQNRFQGFTVFELKLIYYGIFRDLRDAFIKDVPNNLLNEIKTELKKRNAI